MQAIPSDLEVYPVHHLPIIKAYADQLGLVSLINHYVPTEMEVDAGTVVLAMVLDTLSGRSPLYRLEEFFAQQDTELLLGKAAPPAGLERRYRGPGPRSPLRLRHDAALYRLCHPRCHAV